MCSFKLTPKLVFGPLGSLQCSQTPWSTVKGVPSPYILPIDAFGVSISVPTAPRFFFMPLQTKFLATPMGQICVYPVIACKCAQTENSDLTYCPEKVEIHTASYNLSFTMQCLIDFQVFVYNIRLSFVATCAVKCFWLIRDSLWKFASYCAFYSVFLCFFLSVMRTKLGGMLTFYSNWLC